MKFIIKLLSPLVIVSSVHPLMAQQEVTRTVQAGSEVMQIAKTGVDATRVSQAAAEALRAAQVGVEATAQASQAGITGATQASMLGSEALRTLQAQLGILSTLQVKQLTVPNLSRAEVAKIVENLAFTSYNEAHEIAKDHHDLFFQGAPLQGMQPFTKTMVLRMFGTGKLYPEAPALNHKPWFLARYHAFRENENIKAVVPSLAALKQEIITNIPNFKQAQWWYNGFYGREDGPMMKDVVDSIPPNTSYLLLGYNDAYTFTDSEIYYQISVLLRELRWKNPSREIMLLTDEEEILNSDSPSSMVQLIPETASRYGISTQLLSHVGPTSTTLEGRRLQTNYMLSVIEKLHQKHPDALIVVYAEDGMIRSYQPLSLGAALHGPNTFSVSITNSKIDTWFDQITHKQFKGNGILFFDASKPELTDLFGVNMQVRIPYRSHPGRLVAVP